MKINIKKTRDDAILPTRPDDGSGAYDLYSLSSAGIPPHTVGFFSIGISLEIPQGYAGIIYDRSGMGRKGWSRHGGFIDSSYRGELGVCLNNCTDEVKYINIGDRIAQIAFQKVEDIEFIEVNKLSETKRGEKGFGASGL